MEKYDLEGAKKLKPFERVIVEEVLKFVLRDDDIPTKEAIDIYRYGRQLLRLK